MVQEARNALEETREAINAFIANQWDHRQLEPIDELLTSVRGGLSMVPLARAAEDVAACRRYIREQLIARKQVPDWTVAGTAAELVVGETSSSDSKSSRIWQTEASHFCMK